MTNRLARTLSLAILLLPLSVGAEPEVVDMVPDDRAGWSATNLFAPITGFFLGGPGYWYGKRHVEIETTPAGATLDLFYVRYGFQKRYEQAESPVRVVLPTRVEAGKRDTLKVRALLDGYKQRDISLKVRGRDKKIVLDLEPLPNALLAVTNVYFAGRGSLGFLTKEAATFRVHKSDRGFRVVLLQTAKTDEAAATIEGVRNAQIRQLAAQQLGEDLIVSVNLDPSIRGDAVDIRSRQSFDAVRGLHAFSLDLVPPDGGAGAVAQARAALAAMGSADAGPCAERLDRSLHESFDLEALSRALTPKGSFTDPYLRAAMKRLGEVSPGGAVTLYDGTTYRVAAPIELAAASSQAANVRGYLAFVRGFVRRLESPDHARETLRGLIAPELGTARFDEIMDRAEDRERTCLARR